MRSLLRLPLVLALGLCSSLAAQDTATPPQQVPPSDKAAAAPKPPPPTGSIHGTVFCGDTHKPARGAFIMIMPVNSSAPEGRVSGPAMNRTGMDGSYTIPNISEGDYGVIALLPGYLSPMDQLSTEDLESNAMPAALNRLLAQEGTVHVAAHQTASHDVTLTRGASISGHVLFSDGSPASQVNLDVEDIHAKPSRPKPGEPDINVAAMMRSMFTHQTNGTDDEGRYRISGIAPGTYRIAAVSASMAGLDESAMNEGAAMFSGMITDRNALHVYSGDTLHKSAAKTYDLRAGDNITGVDITIPLNAFHQVHGVLAATDGRPINAAQLTLTDTTDDSFHFSARPADDGSFTFATVPAGTYKLAGSQAHIMAPYPNQMEDRFAIKHPVNAFADADTTIIVKDSDLLEVSLPLTEVPLPKEDNPGSPTPPPQ